MEEVRYMEVANDLNLIALGQSSGVVYWKPSGFKLYENLKQFIRKYHVDNNYCEVKSPSMVISNIFEKSGHMEKYRDNMFFIKNEDNEENVYAMRPMSCPNHIFLYQSESRSYKDLPVKFFEFGDVYRNESSGALQLLFRQRQFCQDDSHIFVNEDKMVEVLKDYLNMSKQVYNMLGFKDIKYAVSLRPEKRFGSDDLWDKAENALKLACKENNVEFEELEGGGAFYGPKIEMQVKDKLNRFWQMGVIQLDYVLPERFDLEYINKDGKKERPVILHHAVLGSLERMIGVLLESFGKNLPDFLHPYNSVIVPVSDKSLEYAKKFKEKINDSILDERDEPLGKKLEFWRKRGAPNIYVLGEKEAQKYFESGVFSAMLNKGVDKIKIELE